jgi:hypothetical protein
MMIKYCFALLLACVITNAHAQQIDTLKPEPKVKKENKPVKFFLNEDGSRYVQFTGLLQVWVRYNENNPNSTINKQTNGAESTFDVGLRRVRFQTLAQITDKAFFYVQIGENSFGYLSERKFGLFLMDATGDYEFVKRKLSFGAGLGSWVGPSRFSSPSVGTFMGMDGPINLQTTNDLNDQFVRRLMVYAKGKLGKFDYRVSVAKPFIVNSGANVNGTGQATIGFLSKDGFQNDIATFSTRDPEVQLNSYVAYNLFDEESNKTPYYAGTYYGAKKVFNIGGGIQYQQNAMWYTTVKDPVNNPAVIDTVSHQLLCAAVDVFYDAPLNKEKGTALSFYAAYLYSDYGRNYIRNLGVMNAADGGQGYSGKAGMYNSGGGSAFAMNGTGSTVSAQLGYKMKDGLIGEQGTLMPYVMTQLSGFQYFDYKVMSVYNVGLNWMIKGHSSKFSLDYQNRPYFQQTTASEAPKSTVRKGMVVLQYQLSF